MSNKLINKQQLERVAQGDTDMEQLAKYARSTYFSDKDKKAKDFLKKHPLPAKFTR